MWLIKGYKDTYYIRFKKYDTRRYTKISCHTKDENEAERFRDVYIKEHREEIMGFNDITLMKLKYDIEEFHIKHKSKKTKSNYNIVFNGLEKLFGSEYLIKNILPIDIEKYKNTLIDKGNSNGTVNSYLRVVKCIFNKAVHKFKYLKENPCYEVDFLEEPERQKAFNESEIDFLTGVIDNEPVLNIFLFGVYSGSRIGEILNLQWKDLDLKDKTISVLNNRSFKTKNRKIRQVPISEELFYIIKEIQLKQFSDNESNIINLQNYVFTNPKGGKYSVEYISKSFKKYLRAYGFEEDYNFHSTRYTAATLMAKNGRSIIEIQKILGHSNIKVTMRYIKVPSKEMHDAVNSYHIESIRKRYVDSKRNKKVFEMNNM